MLFGRRWFFAAWLALTAGCAVGGWFFGRGEFNTKEPPERETRTTQSRRTESVFAADSPMGQWTERVKKATPADFPRLLEDWKTLFSETEDRIEGQPERALRWLFAEWLVRDRESFVRTVTDKDFKWPHQAALVIVRLNPEMISALHLLSTEMDGGSSRQLQVGAELLRSICEGYSVESCLSAAKLWAAELRNGERDDETFKSLAERSAAIDPDNAEAALDSLPEVARASFAAEIVKRLPPEEVGRRRSLLERLTPAQWDRYLGESLGKRGADYADAIFKLPASTTSEAQPHFMSAWVENDPDSAIHWFSSLPQDEAFGPAALGLFEGWESVDSSAALAWAESLANGPFRQAVAFYVTSVLAKNSPREAWRWASSITDPEARASAYGTISSVHGDGAPAEFNKEREAAARAVGME